jgi:ankyrin repeat protein
MKLFKFSLLILTCTLSTISASAKDQTVVVNYNTDTALMKAISSGSLATVKKLIKEGADINQQDAYKNTPLVLAIKNARPISEFSGQAQARTRSRWQARKKIIQVLLEAGANIKHVNKWGSTALMEAVKNNDLNTVQDLIKLPEMTKSSFFGFSEKPINYANKDGNTALIIAIKHIITSYIVGDRQSYHSAQNSQKIVDALFKTPGIDLYHINNKGETAISLFNKLHKQNKHLPGF